MKLLISGFSLVTAILAAGLAVAVPLTNTNNPHNMSSNATHGGVKALDPGLGGTTEICVFCHTPHGARAQSTLWNRNDPGNTGSFPLYSSGTLNIDSIPAAQYSNANPATYPNGASRMCLSCHDGSTAGGFGIGDVLNSPPSSFGGAIQMNIATLNGRSSQVDLAAAHPISFVYTSAIAATISAAKNPSIYQMPSLVSLDDQSRMQCTTCHDPHDDRSEHAGQGVPPFWRYNNGTADHSTEYQATCNDCHDDFASYGSPDHGLRPSFP